MQRLRADESTTRGATDGTERPERAGGFSLRDLGRGLTVADRSEDLHVRNHDFQRSYHLRVTAEQVDGDVRYQKAFTVAPDVSVGELNVLEAGTYDVTVACDDDETSQRCRVGDAPHESVRIDLGNGVVTLRNE
jgi:hypothetical protein